MEAYSAGKISKAERDSVSFGVKAEIQEAGYLAAATAMKKLAAISTKVLKSTKIGSKKYNQFQAQLHAAQSMAQMEDQNSQTADALDKRVSSAVKMMPFAR